MGISIGTVTNYLFNQVGEGAIFRSDIVFSIRTDIRQEINRIVEARSAKGRGADRNYLKSFLYKKSWAAPDIEDALVYRDLHAAGVALGDMYQWIYVIETYLHQYIKSILVSRYGPERDRWWRQGVQKEIRVKCAQSYEEDDEPAEEPYCYTTFIQLGKILSRNWGVFSPLFPERVAKGKHELEKGLEKLNQIRNRVMHPSKGICPSEDDFLSVHTFLTFLEIGAWKTATAAEAKINRT